MKKWTNDYFIENMQEKVAKAAVGPSAMRNQLKGIGTITVIQDYCAAINLSKYAVSNENIFYLQLMKDTEAIVKLTKQHAKWGSARKAINLFLRDVVYNKYLCAEYKLDKTEGFLELPLDNKVIKRLRKEEGNKIASWSTIKDLLPNESNEFQKNALSIANKKGTKQIHLDTEYWPTSSN